MEALALGAMAKKALSWAWSGIKAHAGLLPYIAVAFAMWWLWTGKQAAIADRDAAVAKVAVANTATENERTAHQKTKNDYRAAQAEAARLEAERNAREKARQQEINDAASKDYAQRVADLRTRYQRLFDDAQARSTAGSASGIVAVPSSGIATGGTAQAADLRLAGAAGLCLDPEERLIAAEQSIQLDALITAVTKLAEQAGDGQ